MNSLYGVKKILIVPIYLKLFFPSSNYTNKHQYTSYQNSRHCIKLSIFTIFITTKYDTGAVIINPTITIIYNIYKLSKIIWCIKNDTPYYLLHLNYIFIYFYKLFFFFLSLQINYSMTNSIN